MGNGGTETGVQMARREETEWGNSDVRAFCHVKSLFCVCLKSELSQRKLGRHQAASGPVKIATRHVPSRRSPNPQLTTTAPRCASQASDPPDLPPSTQSRSPHSPQVTPMSNAARPHP
jgi:hypothetical protein